MLQIVLSVVPVLLAILFFIFKKQKINNWINLLFYGGLCVIISLLLIRVLELVLPIPAHYDAIYVPSLTRFISMLIYAGFTEEISKYIVLRCTKPKTKNEVLINIIFIGLIFAAYEDYLYIGTYMSLNVGVLRAITPGHLTFAVIMGAFLMKAFEYKETGNKSLAFKYEALGLLLAIFGHTIFDWFVADGWYSLMPKIVGRGVYIIISLVIPFIWLFKYFKSDNNIEKEKTKFKILKIIFIICFTLFVFGAGDIDSKTGKLNKVMNIDDLKLTVTSAENVREGEFDGLLDDEIKDYVKVTLKIKNTNKEDFNGVYISFSLVDKNNRNNALKMDYLKSDVVDLIAYDEEQELKFYFEGKLDKNSQLKVTVRDKSYNPSYYYFSLK